MAIKVKHEGNVTSRVVASSLGGEARRNAEDSKSLAQMAAQQNMAANRPLGGVHASPAAPGHATATPGHATAPMVSAPRPPTDPVRAAAVQQRVGDVRNTQQLELIDVQHKNAKERAEQSALLGLEGKVKEAQLNAPPRPGPLPAVQTPFPSVPETPAPTPPKVPEKPGSVSIIPSGAVSDSDMPELYNMMQSMQPDLLKMRDEFKNEGLQGPFDKAMTIALKAISKGGPDGALSTDSVESGGSKLGAIFDSILAQRGGGTPAVQTPDEIESVYANGGSIFGDQSMNGSSRALSWLNPPDMDAASIGGDAAASKDYASSVGGMIDAFLHRNNNYV